MELSKISVSPMPVIEIKTNDEQRSAAAHFSPARQLFFRQLHIMLEHESSNANGCVKWLDDSRGFTITDRGTFSMSILKRHFGEAKYASFTRRLKRWGFRRITKEADSGAYYHDEFYRGMNFDGYEDDIGSMSRSESSQSLPPKKRMARSPAPSYKHSTSNTLDPLLNQCDDVSVIPEIMREINRSKRCEKSVYDSPAAKRTKYNNGCFHGQSAAASMPMPRNYAYSSFGNRSEEDSHDHLDYLASLKRQVYEENQDAFNMDYHASGNLRNSMNSLSNVSSDILKREVGLRQMRERLGNKSYRVYNQSPFYGYNVNMSSMIFNGSRESSTMRHQNYFNDRIPQDEYAARALGSLKGPSDISEMPYMQKKSRNQMNRFNEGSNTNSKNTYDSGVNKVPIPGINQMEPRNNPFNRAA